MEFWSTGAPWVFDIVGSSFAGFTVLAMGGGAAVMQGLTQAFRTDPRIRNLTRASLGFGCLAISFYVAHFLAWGMGGYGKLLGFSLQFGGDAWSWTVWLTLGLWAFITVSGFICLRGMRALLGGAAGDRNAIPFGGDLLTLAIFGGLWSWGAFFPVPLYRDFPLIWELATGANFFLHCLFIGATVESAAALLLAWLTAFGSGDAMRRMKKFADERNKPMISARAPQKKSRWNGWRQ